MVTAFVLNLRLSAIGEEFAAVDEAAVVGSEKQRGGSRFVGRPIRPSGICASIAATKARFASAVV